MEQSSIRLVLRSADVTVADFVQTLLKPQTCIDVTVRVKLQRGSKAGNVWVTLDSHWESNTNGGRDHPQIRSMNLKMCCKAVRQSEDCEKRMLCVCVLRSYTWVSPATAATARHSRQVSGETKLGHFHLPGKLVDHDIPQSQVTVNNLHREPTTLMQNVNTTIKSVFKLSKTKVTLGQSGTSIFPISLLCSYHFGAQVLHG